MMNLPNLASNHLCTGCTACASVCPKACIVMSADDDGFRYPMIDESACVGCGLCEKVCPVLGDSRPDHKPTAWAAMSRDTGIRLESSSGGIFTELARHILAQGGAVFGAVYGEDFRVEHHCAETEADLSPMRGAKYAQSDLDGIFSNIKHRLDQGQRVLFSGTPCQVEGLLSFLRKPCENLVTLDFVCHSVPSPLAWQEYIHSLGDVQTINLRAKDTGWSRYGYCHRIGNSRGEIRLIPNSDSLYMKLFVGNYITRHSCAHCRFKGYARRSDLTIGDFWGVWDSHPDMDDDRGTSVVLVQSEQGKVLWDAVRPGMIVRQVSLQDAAAQNPAMLESSPEAQDRDTVMTRIRSGDLIGCAELFKTPQLSLPRRIRSKVACILRRLLGRAFRFSSKKAKPRSRCKI